MRVDLVTCDQKTRSCSHSKNIAFNPAEEPDIPLMNLKISLDKKAIGDYLHKQTHYLRRSEVYGDRPLVPVTYIMTEQKGDLRVSAMFMGQVQSQLCDMQGRCLIIFSDYASYGKEYVFYSWTVVSSGSGYHSGQCRNPPERLSFSLSQNPAVC